MDNLHTLNMPIELGAIDKMQGVLTRQPINKGTILQIGSRQCKTVHVEAVTIKLFVKNGKVMLSTWNRNRMIQGNQDTVLKKLGFSNISALTHYFFTTPDTMAIVSETKAYLSTFNHEFSI